MPYRRGAPGERLRVVAGGDRRSRRVRFSSGVSAASLFEHAARLERAGVLEELGLESHARREVGPVDERRPSDDPAHRVRGSLDVGPRDGRSGHRAIVDTGGAARARATTARDALHDAEVRDANGSRLLTTAALALAAGAWLALAWWLTDSAVPDGLVLPELDVRRTFGADLVAEAERYENVLLALWALGRAAVVAALVLWAWRGPAWARESAAGPIGTGMLLGMLGLTLAWVVRQPFRLVAVWWERRHDVSQLGYADAILEGWAVLLASFVFLCAGLLVVMALARRLGERWWIPGAAIFVALVALFSWVAPLLPAEDQAVDDAALEARYLRLARAEGLEGIPLRLEVVSGETSQANAFAWGVAGSREIVLWDTLVDGRFTDGEVDVVLAHELAHHAGDHLREAIGWFALLALPCAWVLMRATRRRGGMGEAAAVPQALLVAAVLQLALSPVQGAISRANEREADWRALEATRDPASARALFVGFAETSLGDPSPPRWATLLLGSHPTLADRVRMVEAWRARSGAGGER